MLKQIHWWLAFSVCVVWPGPLPVAARPHALWGRIANHKHHGQRILSALYFAGPPNPIAFSHNGIYGFNAAWRERQRQLAARYGRSGLSIDTWNGWTEGYAIPPSQEDGDVHLRWVRDVLGSLPPPGRR